MECSNCECKLCCGCNGENDDHYHQDGECFHSKHENKNLGNIKPQDPEIIALRNKWEEYFDGVLKSESLDSESLIALREAILKRMQ